MSWNANVVQLDVPNVVIFIDFNFDVQPTGYFPTGSYLLFIHISLHTDTGYPDMSQRSSQVDVTRQIDAVNDTLDSSKVLSMSVDDK